MSDNNRNDEFLDMDFDVEKLFDFEKGYTQQYNQNQMPKSNQQQVNQINNNGINGNNNSVAQPKPVNNVPNNKPPVNNTPNNIPPQNYKPNNMPPVAPKNNAYAGNQNQTNINNAYVNNQNANVQLNLDDDIADDEDIMMEEEYKERRSYKRRRRVQSRFANFLKSLIYMMFVFTVSLVVGVFILSSAFDFIGVARPNDEASVEFTIQDGDSIEDIAARLKENDIITQPKVFELFIRVVKSDTVFTPGTYTVKTNADYNSLIHQLQYVSSNNSIVRLTFPEGYTLDEIAADLEKAGVCSKKDFIECIQSDDFSDHPLVKAIEENPDRYYRLEGYLYPDTYDFYQGEAVKSVVNKFLNALEANITDTFTERADELGMSMDEIITLASLIQKEAAQQEDMFNVSAVFHNRLNSSDMRYLQTDTTTNYPSSKYDTYNIQGLPPGPICSPGLQAIEAALWPAEDQKALYFASDNDGKFYYARTYDEHLANWKEIEAVNGN